MKAIPTFFMTSPRVHVNGNLFYDSQGRIYRKARPQAAEVILVVAVDKGELESLLHWLIRCPGCGHEGLFVYGVKRSGGETTWVNGKNLTSEDPFPLPEKFGNEPCHLLLRCNQCGRKCEPGSSGYGLAQRDLLVTVYWIRDRTTTDYPSLRAARAAVEKMIEEEER